MAIKKGTFKSYLRHYISMGMSPKEAYQRMLKEGFDGSIVGIPNQINNLINSGIPFERALSIVQDAAIDNNFDSYKAALQEYMDRKRRVYRSPEPNGRDRIDVNKIVRDALSNKPELGTSYYPPMGMSISPNSQHSQYSVVPKEPITEGMSPTPTKYPYELGIKANQDLAPEGYTPMPVSRNYTPIPTVPVQNNSEIVEESPKKLPLPIGDWSNWGSEDSSEKPETIVPSNTNSVQSGVVIGPDLEKNASAPESNTMKVYDTKTGTTNTYNSSTGELVSTSNTKQSPSVNSVIKGANTPRVVQRRAPATPPAITPTVANAPVIPVSATRPVMPAPNKTSLASAYKRDLWNLINSKGISSPAEAVQRGIIPAEYLNLF